MDDLELFALGARANLECLPDQVFGRPLHRLDFDAHPRFALLLNVFNGHAYGGVMGMPEWVMLDCGLLPAMFVGVMGPGRLLEQATRDAIARSLAEAKTEPGRQALESGTPELSGLRRPIADEEKVPLVEFCAIPAVAPGTVVGYSLYSMLRHRGVAAKAVGLELYRQRGVARQIGVAQYDAPTAIRTHVKFGPLRLLRAITPVHSRAEATFVYQLDVPGEEALRELARLDRKAQTPTDRDPAPTLHIRPGDIAAARALDTRLRSGESEAWIVAPGTENGHVLIHERALR